MKKSKSRVIRGGLAGAVMLTSPVFAAQTLLINFSDRISNDITTAEATSLGADLFENVRTDTFGAGGNIKNISLDGVTGTVNYADYYQANQKVQLGQPFATYLGSSNLTGLNLESTTSLDLSTWMTNEGYSAYTVKIFYAGRSAVSETELTTGASEVHLDDGSGAVDDTITVTTHGTTTTAYWGGNGATHTFTGSSLTIEVDNLAGNGNDSGGISAIEITGVPEPSSTVLLGLGGLALIMRRKK